MARDYVVFLYEAKKTNSKYLTVTYGNKKFTVRFSDHRPIRHRELAGDCDFFVGVTNTGVRDIVDAIEACLRYFDDVPEIRKIDRSDLDKMAKKEQGEAPKENAR